MLDSLVQGLPDHDRLAVAQAGHRRLTLGMAGPGIEPRLFGCYRLQGCARRCGARCCCRRSLCGGGRLCLGTPAGSGRTGRRRRGWSWGIKRCYRNTAGNRCHIIGIGNVSQGRGSGRVARHTIFAIGKPHRLDTVKGIAGAIAAVGGYVENAGLNARRVIGKGAFKHCKVIPAVAVQNIVPAAAGKGIIAGAAFEGVFPSAAKNLIVAFPTGNLPAQDIAAVNYGVNVCAIIIGAANRNILCRSHGSKCRPGGIRLKHNLTRFAANRSSQDGADIAIVIDAVDQAGTDTRQRIARGNSVADRFILYSQTIDIARLHGSR